jgi:hypothetical protein
MTGPPCTMPAALERSVALTLIAAAGLMGAIRELTPVSPPPSLRGCLADVRTMLRLANVVERRPAVNPDDAPPETVRADATLRALAHALREQAEPLMAELAAALTRRRGRSGPRPRR